MSFISKRSLLERIRRGKESRNRLVSSNLDKGIAFQIRATRNAKDWTQGRLAEETGMSPNNISRIESEDYGKQTLTSLKRIADALDVALVVRFVPFSQYIDWLSGTPFLDEGIRPEALMVPSFEEEEKLGLYESDVKYFGFHVTQNVPVTGNNLMGTLLGFPPQQKMGAAAELYGHYQSFVSFPLTSGKVAS